MKKLLIILLIVGCNYAPTGHTHEIGNGICEWRSGTSVSGCSHYYCLDNMDEFHCEILSDNDNYDYLDYIPDTTCVNYCTDMASMEYWDSTYTFWYGLEIECDECIITTFDD